MFQPPESGNSDSSQTVEYDPSSKLDSWNFHVHSFLNYHPIVTFGLYQVGQEHAWVDSGAAIWDDGEKGILQYDPDPNERIGWITTTFGISWSWYAVSPDVCMRNIAAKSQPNGLGSDTDHDGHPDFKDDSDDDRICDWDETNRWFHHIEVPGWGNDYDLDPQKKDSNGDGKSDMDALIEMFERKGLK